MNISENNRYLASLAFAIETAFARHEGGLGSDFSYIAFSQKRGFRYYDSKRITMTNDEVCVIERAWEVGEEFVRGDGLRYAGLLCADAVKTGLAALHIRKQP